MFMCFVYLLLEALPFFSKRMELLLAWNKMLSISFSVELRVLSFCLVELTMGKPHPRDSPPPECPRMLGCTANDASTHHFRMPLPLTLRISGIVRVPMMYLIKLTNLFQSSLSGARTLVVRNTIAVQVSGLARLLEYNVFFTRLLNSIALSCLIFSQFSSTLERLSGAALVLVPPPFGAALSKAGKILSI
jgi:hypothetical protein